MDERLNQALHRKRYILKWNYDLDLASHLTFSPEVCNALNNIEPNERIQFIVDHEGFDSLISILEATGSGLDQELLSEYKIDMTPGDVNDSINKECSVLVHRAFGKSKIISEAEKKYLQNLLSTRVRVIREAYQNHLENINRKLQFEKEKGDNLNKMITEATFVLSTSVAENLDEINLDENRPIDHLDNCVDHLIKLCSTALIERDSLVCEMKSALSEIDLSHPQAVIERLQKINVECNQATTTETEKNKEIAIIELDIRKIRKDMDHESSERKNKISSLQMSLNKTIKENNIHKAKINTLKDELKRKGQEMNRINNKLSSVLERSTRLNGQLNKGKSNYL